MRDRPRRIMADLSSLTRSGLVKTHRSLLATPGDLAQGDTVTVQDLFSDDRHLATVVEVGDDVILLDVHEKEMS